MIDSQTTMIDAVRRGARAALQVAEDASADEVRAAFLTRLEDEDFLPPPEVPAAFRVLMAANESFDVSGADARKLAGASLTAEVEQFARDFFTLSPEARQKDFLALGQRCQGVPKLLVRLKALRAGLELDAADLPPGLSDARSLAEEALACFVMHPVERAVRRQAYLRVCADDRRRWRAAAVLLKKKHPRITACEPRFLEYLATRPAHAYARNRSISRARHYRWKTSALAGARKHSTLLFVIPLLTVGFFLGLFGFFEDSSKPRPVPAPALRTLTPQESTEAAQMLERMFKDLDRRKRLEQSRGPKQSPTEAESDSKRRPKAEENPAADSRQVK